MVKKCTYGRRTPQKVGKCPTGKYTKPQLVKLLKAEEGHERFAALLAPKAKVTKLQLADAINQLRVKTCTHPQLKVSQVKLPRHRYAKRGRKCRRTLRRSGSRSRSRSVSSSRSPSPRGRSPPKRVSDCARLLRKHKPKTRVSKKLADCAKLLGKRAVGAKKRKTVSRKRPAVTVSKKSPPAKRARKASRQ